MLFSCPCCIAIMTLYCKICYDLEQGLLTVDSFLRFYDSSGMRDSIRTCILSIRAETSNKSGTGVFDTTYPT